MRFSIGKLTLLIAVAFLAANIGSVKSCDEVASDAVIHRAGLKVDWFTHSGVGARGKLVDWHLTVNEDKPTTFFVIEAGTYREKFSQNKLNAFGKPFGVDDAVDYCQIRKEVLEAELANDGKTDVEVKIDQYTLPESTIYTMTDSGLVKSINADTGQTNWSVRVGNGRHPSIGVGASNKYVAAINGSTVYCLEADSGKTLWTRPCRNGVSAPPAVSDEKIYVPLINGRLESFEIENKGFNSSSYVSLGLGTTRPLVTEKTVSWATNRGDFNVAGRWGGRGVGYQLRADESIVAPPVFKDDMLFVTSLDGFIYALDEGRGSLRWQVSTGRSISQSALPLRNFVFAINDNKELFKLDTKTGIEAPGWELPRPNMERFLGASKENLYIVDSSGQLRVVSQNTGQTLSRVSFGSVDKILPNTLNDRLYIASKRGMILSVRESASNIPYFHSAEYVAPVMAVKAKAAIDNDPTKPEAAATDLTDPFGAKDADPFGAKPSESDDDDPFKQKSEDDDPFSQKPSGEDEDPFATGK
ncbi:MAG: PQQ-binding-like beta-propeller repeat protein [Mariniblastus sp.]